ncbi:benzoate-CoA ligase family protein [Ferrimicrobium acidiphilum]|uniref:benzoate-CoA ligase family protein n=1 Tax=Ferrimicrobium acidiphilum TaxID=121039 RepID=UPI0023F3E8B6|nr:benzoate-CoA ligase family protein [Ferrimicrobium acidiphilum]MCL5053237.1 benzoate-CoA ligase family protein [Gammaproteobacteria bacterium]
MRIEEREAMPIEDWLAALPKVYNIADRLLANSQLLPATKRAVIDADGSYSYLEVQDLVLRAATALRELGLEPEDRLLLIIGDTILFPTLFLGAIRAGIVPIPLNPLLSEEDFRYIIEDSRVKAIIAAGHDTDKINHAASTAARIKWIEYDNGLNGPGIGARILAASPYQLPVATVADEIAFWLYSSGSTGRPKGVRHLHRNVAVTIECFAERVLGLRSTDAVFSAAKLFFAYGLGNGLTFPFGVGASAIYLNERPTPDSVIDLMETTHPTVFCGVPTLFASLLASPRAAELADLGLRICTSAGEALPPEIGRRFEDLTGAPIIDGLGSTEMLHIFLANRPGQIRYGSSGVPVPGYEAQLLDENGSVVTLPDTIGELVVRGYSAADGYWNQRDKSLATFRGHWTHTGDKYLRDDDGFYYYAGRSDDMMKVSGNWVSPFEVESALIAHPKVLEAAVVPWKDTDTLIKPKAYVVLQPKVVATTELTVELQAFVKEQVSPWKYPRWIEFVEELPKTATGKIQRFKLRES